MAPGFGKRVSDEPPSSYVMQKDTLNAPVQGWHSSAGTPFRCLIMKSPIAVTVSVLNRFDTPVSEMVSLSSHA